MKTKEILKSIYRLFFYKYIIGVELKFLLYYFKNLKFDYYELSLVCDVFNNRFNNREEQQIQKIVDYMDKKVILSLKKDLVKKQFLSEKQFNEVLLNQPQCILDIARNYYKNNFSLEICFKKVIDIKSLS